MIDTVDVMPEEKFYIYKALQKTDFFKDRRASDFFLVGLTSGTGRSSVGCSRGSVLAALLSDDTEIIQSIPCFVRVGFIACHSAFPAATTAR